MLPADQRLAALHNWLATLPEVAGLPLAPASGDASFRRYFRLRDGKQSWIVMDAPPPMEDCRPFVSVAGFLQSMSLNVPEILAAEPEQGFLLMTDLGTCQYLDALRAEPSRAAALYDAALDALMQLQQRGEAFADRLPDYDEALLVSEMQLFSEWLCGRHLGLSFSEPERAAWNEVCRLLASNAMSQPKVFVHRDYHSRNLMFCDAANPGILDFQDAMHGPLSYDLASLLKDCYVRLPSSEIGRLAQAFYAGLDEQRRAGLSYDGFFRSFELMGVQRHLKAAGIFARLLHRDGKSGYVADIPRTVRYIVDAATRYAELGFLAELIEERILPKLGAAE